MMKSRKIILGIALFAAVTVTLLSIHSCRKSNTYIFETAPVKMGSIVNTVTATGTLEAITSVVVGTQVSGIVDKLYVDFNSPVKKGQVLAELDKTALRSGVQQALASLDNSKAEMEYESSNYERSKALYDKNLIAQADYDQAKYNYEKSLSTLKNSQAQYDKALVQLGYATIYSPIDGVVMNRAVDEGQTVAASFNTPEIFTIAQDLTQMQVEADIDESDIGMVKVGQRVEFDVDAYPDEKFAGTVEQIRLSPVTISNVVTYTVIINAPNPEKKLLPGMTANIVIYVEEADNVLTIPYKAVKFTPGAEYLAKQGKQLIPGEGAAASKRGDSLPGAGRPAAATWGADTKSSHVRTGNRSAAGTATGMHGMPAGQMPQAATTPGRSRVPTVVWVKETGGIHPVNVKLGSNDGDNIEVKAGLKEGDNVVIQMTVATGKEKKTKAVASNPFIPTRPGRRSTQRSTGSGTNTSARN